jgi:glutathione synthase/RimK-type ligase-like ATP-grasp enzyme
MYMYVLDVYIHTVLNFNMYVQQFFPQNERGDVIVFLFTHVSVL